MKYLVLLLDGMADRTIKELGDKTPLEAAYKPCMDELAKSSLIGMVHVTPDGCKGGSDVGNLSIMGYDPRECLSGRSPLEAASLGIEMKDDDLAMRCNLVCLSSDEDYENKTMKDYSAGEISTDEARELIEFVNKNLGSVVRNFYAGVSYRHCLILHNIKDNEIQDMRLTPPHNITNKKITDYLPKGKMSGELYEMMKKSNEILPSHPVNQRRIKEGKNPANSIWLWGQGRKMSLIPFELRHKVRAAVVTAVDLIKGIAVCANMKVCEVEGATGTLETNFEGKAAACIDDFKNGTELVYLHLEAPDECGHQGDIQGKMRACEIIDKKVLKPVYDYLRSCGEEFKILITPDHPTLLSTQGHDDADVPYLLFDSKNPVSMGLGYCEKDAYRGQYVSEGFDLIDIMIEGGAKNDNNNI